MLLNIENVLSKSKYVGVSNHKGKLSHIFETDRFSHGGGGGNALNAVIDVAHLNGERFFIIMEKLKLEPAAEKMLGIAKKERDWRGNFMRK